MVHKPCNFTKSFLAKFYSLIKIIQCKWHLPYGTVVLSRYIHLVEEHNHFDMKDSQLEKSMFVDFVC